MQTHLPQAPVDRIGRQEIHLRDYLTILKKRRTTVFTFLIIAVLLVAIVSFSMTPIYTASSQVLIEENYGDNSLEGTYSYRRYDQAFLNTQFKIIRSSNVIKKVIEQLQLDTKYRDYFLPDEQEGAGLVASVKQKAANLFKIFSAGSGGTDDEESGEALLEMEARPATDLEMIVEEIQDNLKIIPEEETRVVNIMYSHRHPGMAKLVTDFLITAYKEELQEIKHSSSSDTLKWMSEKAEEERKKLEASEQALQDYMRKNDIITVENKLAIYPEKLTEFSTQLSSVQAERKKLESTYSLIEEAQKKGKDLENIPIFADSPVLQSLREQIFKAEQNIKQLSKTYGYKNPVMINAKEELNSLRKEKEFEINRIIDSTENAYDLAVSQEKNITELLNKTKNELLDLNDKFVQYSIMKREVNTNSVLYDTLTSSLKKASVTEQSQSVNVWVIKEAVVPRDPSSPRKILNLFLGLVLGSLGGIVLAFFVEYLDNTVKSAEEVEQRFGLTVLGAIEELKGKENQVESFVLKEPLSPFAESYRLIRSSILLSSPGHPPRVMLFTSMAPSEGKSVTTLNIARILQQSGRKVLVIDCDMRRPRQHAIFAIPNSLGLSSFLTGNTQENIVQSIDNGTVSLITAGPTPPNPAELLDSAKMKSLLDRMKEMYDFVLLDSPPIQSVTDSLTLSTFADGTVIVVRAGKTTYDMVANGLRKLKAINAHLLGFVLNGVGKTTGGDSYYHGYYKYYSRDESDEG